MNTLQRAGSKTADGSAPARLCAGLAICLSWAGLAHGAIQFVDGHFYSPGPYSRTIYEYDSLGVPVGSLTLPASAGGTVRGLAFGSDQLLYAVVADASSGGGFSVHALDAQGGVHATYRCDGFTLTTSTAYGKIAFDAAGHFYVGGHTGFVRFDTADTGSGAKVACDSGVYDVEPLPGGNVLIARDNNLSEVTPEGSFVKEYVPGGSEYFTDIRGIEYEPATNRIFLVELGHFPPAFYQLMKLDGSTGTLLDSETFSYCSDLVIAADGRLVVASRTQTSGIFTQDLAQIGSFGGTVNSMFITQYVVPEPASLAFLAFVGLWVVRRRR